MERKSKKAHGFNALQQRVEVYVRNFEASMENLPKTPAPQAVTGNNNTTPPKKTADFVYQAATVVAALLLLLTATV